MVMEDGETSMVIGMVMCRVMGNGSCDGGG